MESVRLLLTEPNASLNGEYIAFDDIEMYPKPVQDPLPIYAAGNADASLRRAAKYGQGWLPAGLGPADIRAARDRLADYVMQEERSEYDFAVAPQVIVCVADTREEAEDTFRSSQLFHHLVTLQQSTLKDIDIESYIGNNLVGTPDEICAKIQEFKAAGADHLCGIYFAGNDLDEFRHQMRRFAREIMPTFSDPQ